MEPAGPVPPFEQTVRVTSADIDDLGHVNNVVYLQWVQDIAIAHWQAAAPPDAVESIAWVAMRHEIDYRAAAFVDDELTVRTWVGEASGLTFERRTAITRNADRRLLAEARTLWCPVDRATGRPRRVPAEVRARFSAPTTERHGHA